MLRTARMFYESALYKVALRYPHLSLNFDGLEFDDLVLPPSSEFYYEGLAVSDRARYLCLRRAARPLPFWRNLLSPRLRVKQSLLLPAMMVLQLLPPVRVMMLPARCPSRWSRGLTEDGEMLALIIPAAFIVGYS